MNIRCARIIGPDRDRFTCTVGGRTFEVYLRDVSRYPDSLDLDDANTDGTIHVAAIDKPRKAVKQIAEPFAQAKSGDLVVLLSTGHESRKATLDVLGLDDSGVALDRQ